MTVTYSIAEARNQLATLIRNAEENHQPVQITRRGQPVAVILSAEAYARLVANQKQRNFWAAYQEWRQKWDVSDLNIDPEEIWGDVREHASAPDNDPGEQIVT